MIASAQQRETSVSITDVSGGGCCHARHMLIEISAAQDPPPRGEVRVDSGDPQTFIGWLQLLSILAQTLPLPDTGATSQGAELPVTTPLTRGGMARRHP